MAGYVPALTRFVYRDFHTDGGYSEGSPPPPGAAHTWTWTGIFYPPAQSTPVKWRVLYVERYNTAGRARYDRVFERQTGTGYARVGDYRCDRRSC